LNEIHDLQLSNPADDQDSSTAVTKALGLLYSAYVNERAKEAKWLEEVCAALGIEFSMDNADYIEIIKTLNEV
jgi:MarR-like DNA-binding transcriptional regulator SgrR of sgrS sRNA